MFKWIKRRKCEHDYEITTKGLKRSHGSYLQEVSYYHVTKATCIKCGFSRELDVRKVSDYVSNGRLIKVIRDPLGVYKEFKEW